MIVIIKKIVSIIIIKILVTMIIRLILNIHKYFRKILDSDWLITHVRMRYRDMTWVLKYLFFKCRENSKL